MYFHCRFINVPAPAQGALALHKVRQGRCQSLKQIECLQPVCVEGERHFLHLIGGGCHAALGAHAYRIHNNIHMLHVFYQEGDKVFEFLECTENDDNVKWLAEICAKKIFETIGQ